MAKLKPPSHAIKKSKIAAPSTPVQSYDKLKPMFSLSNVIKTYCCIKESCNNEEKKHILEKLVELSDLTWQEIKNAPKTGMGFELIPIQQFNVSLPSQYDAEEKLYVFRLTKKMRMAGTRRNENFNILIIDRNHNSY